MWSVTKILPCSWNTRATYKADLYFALVSKNGGSDICPHRYVRPVQCECLIYSPCCATDNSLRFRKYFCFHALENINSLALIPSRNEYKTSCFWQGIWVPLDDFNIVRIVVLFLTRDLWPKPQLSATLSVFLSNSHLNCAVWYGKGSECIREPGKNSLNNWLYFGGS